MANDNYIYDGCLDFALGINSGAAPQSLPKNQCAFAVNTTFRGDFASDRPPDRKLLLTDSLNNLLQNAITSGLFQCATSYKGDATPEVIVLNVAGRLFQINPSADPAIASGGSEITIPGDPNPGTIAPTWLWQSERWLIWQDGLSTPIFYDGVSSRRSQTTVALVGQTAADFDVPPLGGSVVVTLAAPYTGLLNSVLNLNEVDATGNVRKVTNYMVTEVNGNTETYSVTLKNLGDTAANHQLNEQVIIQPANLGDVLTVNSYTSAVIIDGNFHRATAKIVLSTAAPTSVTNGNQVLIGTGLWTITNLSADRLTLTLRGQNNVNPPSPVVGQLVILQGASQPNIVVALLANSFVVPAIGASVTASIQQAYTNTVPLIVFIGSGQYEITGFAANTPAASVTVTVQNLNDEAEIDPTTGNTYLKVLTGSQFFNLPELPAGRMGAYGRGRNFQSGIDGTSYIGGDLVGSSSGSPAFENRDSVLKLTENSYLAGGGAFRVPGAGEIINAMLFSATLDTSLGQGPLQVFTNKNIFSCNAPVDRLVWQDLTNPIQTESLKGSGGSSQFSTINLNADILFRSPDAQLRSLRLARMDFNSWVNTPINFEMLRVTQTENQDLMNFCSAIEFDNRLLVTSNPVQSAAGVYWQSLMALNFDNISSLRDKAQPIYDGLWTGLNILQLVRFKNVDRAFAVCLNPTTTTLEIYELLPTGSDHFDNDLTPILWSLESPMLFRDVKGKSVFDLLRLEDGELYASDIIGRVDFKVQYRPDFDTCWHDWHSWFVCAKQGTDTTASNPQYRKRMGFGQPPFAGDCNVNTDQPPQYGTMFQVRLFVRGHCVLNGFRCAASLQPIPKFSPPICNV